MADEALPRNRASQSINEITAPLEPNCAVLNCVGGILNRDCRRSVELACTHKKMSSCTLPLKLYQLAREPNERARVPTTPKAIPQASDVDAGRLQLVSNRKEDCRANKYQWLIAERAQISSRCRKSWYPAQGQVVITPTVVMTVRA